MVGVAGGVGEGEEEEEEEEEERILLSRELRMWSRSLRSSFWAIIFAALRLETSDDRNRS